MLLCAQYILPITSEPIAGGAVLVRDGRIADIGKADMLKMRYPEEEISDYGTAALMPGLVDTHAHMEHSIMRGIVHDVPFITWLRAVTEISQKMDLADWQDSAVLGGLDAISNGITCVSDITHTGASCVAAQKLGLRAVIHREVGAMDKRRVEHAMGAAEADIERWRAEVDADRITVGIAPARSYLCHPLVYGEVAKYATQEKLPVAMHLAASREEYEFVKRGSSAFSVHGANLSRGFLELPPWLPTGVSPIRYALNWGAFECPQVMVLHCVHLEDEDFRKLKDYDVAVAVCPRANAQLGMGVAPVNEFLRTGLRVGLGTDSPAATDTTDMFSEMRLGMLIQRAVNVGEFLDSGTMLEMATIGGARALRLDDKIGSLEVGKLADIIAVDLSSTQQSPSVDPVSNVVNNCGSGDVLMTMIDGSVLYERDKWHIGVEVAKHIARVIEIRGKLRV